MWEEAAVAKKPGFIPPKSFHEAPFKFVSRKFSNAIQTCVAYVYVLSSEKDFPLGHLTGTSEHQEHRWVPLSSLEEFMDSEVAASLREKLLTHTNVRM